MATLRAEVVVRVKRPRRVEITPALLDEAVMHWLTHDIEPPGFQIRTILWQHQGKEEQTSKRGDMRWSGAKAMLANLVNRGGMEIRSRVDRG